MSSCRCLEYCLKQSVRSVGVVTGEMLLENISNLEMSKGEEGESPWLPVLPAHGKQIG